MAANKKRLTKAQIVTDIAEKAELDKKSVNKKTGAYTCTAKAGTAAPASHAACPGSLSYFENSKKGHLGCKP